jgi:hypothetical protein
MTVSAHAVALVGYADGRLVRPMAAVMAALLSAACPSAPDRVASQARICAERGLTPGTDSFLHGTQQEEFRGIRNAPERTHDVKP